jgi:hypothetical protein
MVARIQETTVIFCDTWCSGFYLSLLLQEAQAAKWGKAQEQSAPLPAAYDKRCVSASATLDKSLGTSSGVRPTGGGRETGKKVPQG